MGCIFFYQTLVTMHRVQGKQAPTLDASAGASKKNIKTNKQMSLHIGKKNWGFADKMIRLKVRNLKDYFWIKSQPKESDTDKQLTFPSINH